eukprot:1437716-Amphidinium_carterae.1
MAHSLNRLCPVPEANSKVRSKLLRTTVPQGRRQKGTKVLMWVKDEQTSPSQTSPPPQKKRQ